MRIWSLALAGVAIAASLAAAAVNGSPAANQLYGHITSDRTLTVASPGPVYEVIGDLVVDPNVTLRVERGVKLIATPFSDFTASGIDPERVEISVQGTLTVADGVDSVVFRSMGPASAWTGLRIARNGRALLYGATIRSCSVGLDLDPGASLTLRSCVIADAVYGIRVGGACNYSAGDSLQPAPSFITGCTNGIFSGDQSTALLTNLVVSNCGVGAYNAYSGSGTARMSLSYCTFVNNLIATECKTWSPNFTSQAYELYNCLVVAGTNGTSGLVNFRGTDYSDIWGFAALGGTGFVGNGPGPHCSSFDPFFAPSDPWYHLVPASLFTNFSVSGGQIGAFGPGPGGPTPVMAASVVSADGSSGTARIRWYSESNGTSKAGILRRTEGGDWQPLTVLYPDGEGYVTLEDKDVTPGTRYGYGVGVQHDGQVGVEGEAWVTVESPIHSLSFASIEPNPAKLSWSVSFLTPQSTDCRVQLLDVTGRRVRDTSLGQLSAGRHTVPLSADGLPAGVYWVRVSQGGRSVLAKAVKTN